METTVKHKDMMSRPVQVPVKNTLSIVSVVPSQTELLYDLGLGEQIIGQTLFCIHPREEFKKATKVGGTKKLNLEKIKTLNPDIIIANKEENSKEQIEFLEKHIPVWVSDIETLEDNYKFIEQMGVLFGKELKAKQINESIKLEFSKLSSNFEERPKVVYMIWNDPIMSAGKDTFINHMLNLAGYENLVMAKRYPELAMEEIIKLDPEILMLSSEPFPFKEKHIQYFQEQMPKTKIMLVDGEMFSWYGSRMKLAAQYFQSLKKEMINA